MYCMHVALCYIYSGTYCMGITRHCFIIGFRGLLDTSLFFPEKDQKGYCHAFVNNMMHCGIMRNEEESTVVLGS